MKASDSSKIQVIIIPIILSPCEWPRHEWSANRQCLFGRDEMIVKDYLQPGKKERMLLVIREAIRDWVERIRQGLAVTTQGK